MEKQKEWWEKKKTQNAERLEGQMEGVVGIWQTFQLGPRGDIFHCFCSLICQKGIMSFQEIYAFLTV